MELRPCSKTSRKFLDYVIAHPEITIRGDKESECRTVNTLMQLGACIAAIFLMPRVDLQLKIALRHGLLSVIGTIGTLSPVIWNDVHYMSGPFK